MDMQVRPGLRRAAEARLLPRVGALHLQLRTWKWGDWAGAFDVNPIAAVLIFGIVLLYALGWVLVGIRSRLETYVNLLEASLAERSA